MRFLRIGALILSLSACSLLPAEKIKENDKFSLMAVDGGEPIRIEYDLSMTECHAALSATNATTPADGRRKTSKWYCERQPDGQLM